MDVCLRRLRLAARRRHGVRRAEQLAAGRLQTVLVKSSDRGRTWTAIAGDLPERHDVWAIAQDHVNGDLLFAGTEFGLFASVDGGRHWVQLKGGLPVTQVRDLAVQRRENDLVIATFGRGFYVLDDYTPLREMSAQALTEDAHLSRAARRVSVQSDRATACRRRRHRHDGR